MRVTRRFWVLALLALLGAAVGAGVAGKLLYNRTGRELLWSIDRKLEAKLGLRALTSDRESWQMGRVVPVEIEVVQRGLDGPVRLVFSQSGSTEPKSPAYYIGEIAGSIRVVAHDGTRSTFAEGLLNFARQPRDELGMLGMAVDEKRRFMIVTMTYFDKATGSHHNKVERLGMSDDGLKMTDRRVLLEMKDEVTVPSYQIQFAGIHPRDGSVYIGVGAGGNHRDASDMGKFAGKILRMDADGQSLPDNPFYNEEAPESPRSYIYALGVRNPFDIVWDSDSAEAIVSDVGPGIDRIFRLQRGGNYCYRDDENQMRANSLYSWGPGGSFAPVGVAIAHGDQFSSRPSLYVGLYGPVGQPGTNLGKRILRFDFDPKTGQLESAPDDLVVYGGTRFSSVVDVVTGPDGSLYFTDLWSEAADTHEHAGVVYRVVPKSKKSK
jgi:glucose/arabinose dehydrogenase